MKILLIAYNCGPHEGSEDGIGWNMIESLSRHHDVLVVTRDCYQNDLQAQGLAGKGHTVRYHFVNNPVPKGSFAYRKLTQPLYYLWHLTAARSVRRLTTEEHFDVVHHVTWIRCWMPSAIMGAVSGALVWGPVGGVESTPEAFLSDGSFRVAKERLKRWTVRISRADVLVRRLARRTALGLAATPEAETYMRAMGCQRTHLLSCVALPEDDVKSLAALVPPACTPFRFVSVGRLLAWKGFQYGLRAFALADIIDSEYWIIGSGPMRPKLEALAFELGVADQVRFLGQCERADVLAHLGQCHVLLHPSFRDSGGWACVEAMASGHPVICLDIGGPALQVTAESGCLIAAHSPQQVVTDIAAAMQRYATDRARYEHDSRLARTRVQELFTWSGRAEALSALYETLPAQPPA